VLGLVLMDTQAGPEEPSKVEGYRQMMQGWATHGLSPEVAQYIASIIIAEPQESAKWIAKWQALNNPHARQIATECLLQREDITARLGEIKAPALVIHGSQDMAIPLPLAEALCAGLSGAQPLVLIEGAAHAANLTHASAVNPRLLKFLRQLTSAQS
jgi:pimeloyl-ACP methyl ester carboxylesterase